MRIRNVLLSAVIAVATIGSKAGAQTPPEGAPAPSPKRLSVGTDGFIQAGLLMQGWFMLDRSNATTSTFRLRRAEITLKGEIVPKLVSYGVMFDPTKVLEHQDKTVEVKDQDPAPTVPGSVTVKQPVSTTAVLQDFFLTVAASPYVDVSLGQFKIPVSWEGYNSSAKLLFPERAIIAKEFGDKRDMGVRFGKTFSRFGYTAGVFNGAGPNALDTNNDKDVGLRLEGYPVEGLVLAGVVYGSIGDRKSSVKDRYEADVRFERGPLIVQAEYIRAHDIGKAAPATDADGFYGAVAWTLLGVLQPCVRVGYLDPDVDKNVDPATADGKDEVWHFDAGLNYYLRKNEAKLQLSYSRFQYGTKTANNEVILAAQIHF